MAHYRYFVTDSGVKLPLRPITPIEEADIENRNTCIRAELDGQDRLTGVEKIVYDEAELVHRYEYDCEGGLKKAQITMDGQITVIWTSGQEELNEPRAPSKIPFTPKRLTRGHAMDRFI